MKPVWKYSTQRTVDDATAEKIEKICNVFDFQCVCTGDEMCTLCNMLINLKVESHSLIVTFINLFETLAAFSIL